MIGKMQKLARSLCIASLILLGIFVYSDPRSLPTAHSLTSPISAVYVTPVHQCCIYPNSTSTQIVVNVMANLTAGQSINGFDIRLNYTNYWTPVLTSGVVQANASLGFNTANNIFAGRNPYVSAACIDDQVVYANAICGTDDAIIGQVHLAQTVLGASISGPLLAQFLFSVTFNVRGFGSSLFVVDRAHLLNPGDNTGSQSPQFVQDVTGAGVFGNSRIVSFFDYSPQTPPSVLAGDSTTLDASASYGSTLSGPAVIAQPQYTWNFGDGGPNKVTTTPVTNHQFQAGGNYTVTLTVNDTSIGRGSIIQRVVPVSPVLGGLEVIVRNANGGQISTAVIIQVHNISSSPVSVCPKCTGSVNAGGTAEFRGLSPGFYNITLAGPAVNPASQRVQVTAGWTYQAWVYMTLLTVPQPDTSGLLIFASVTAAGVALVGTVLFVQNRKRRRIARNAFATSKSSKLKK